MINNTDLSLNLNDWFKDRPKWLQEAGYRIITSGNLKDKDYPELLDICLKEATCENFEFHSLQSYGFNKEENSEHVIINSVSKLNGINALSPTVPLNFSESPICIVYGRNGSGKSSYVRLLKQICGTRYSGELLNNIYANSQPTQSAEITFNRDGILNTSIWSGEPIPELCGVDIYDTLCGLMYVNNENEITYEPWILQFFSQLTKTCDRLKQIIHSKILLLPSIKPNLPTEFIATEAGKWYTKINPNLVKDEVDLQTKWDGNDESELIGINKRLSEDHPAAKARVLRHQKVLLDQFIGYLNNSFGGLSDIACRNYLSAKEDAKKKRNAADIDAKIVFQNSPLEGVGSESWMLLWQAAKKYSEEEAYPSKIYPNVEEDAVCVLCQRLLDENSRTRLNTFEKFIKNELQSLAVLAEQKLLSITSALPNILDIEEVDLRLDGIGINDESLRLKIRNFTEALSVCKQKCIEANHIAEVPLLPSNAIIQDLRKYSQELETLALVYDEDAKGQSKLNKLALEMSAKKWLNQQRHAIDDEITRLGEIYKLQSAEDLTNTSALSKRKSILAESLITLPYIQRFEEELKVLKADIIKVGIKKTRTDVGHVYHQIILKGSNKDIRTADILSEGEFRIISLAAFLADTGGRSTSFVFDDPISSLDQVYEESTAQRLVELSKTRQVIVFTHRLSLLGLLEKYSEKEKVSKTIVTLSRIKIGDIAELPITLTKTKESANRLLNARLASAKKKYEISDHEYDIEVKSLCRDIRILLEQVVEVDLLAGVVRRYNPEVQTKGKIEHLAKITVEDCKFIDDLMTAYSRYEHSQPEEAPIDPPRPDELEKDLRSIVTFIETVQKRKSSSTNKMP